ncbi:MAG TPA: NAD(P)H-binding protein [Pyrinomonadaceae bacterium]|jgi:Predicted nucleoside-diphosphate-sugar epimerases|nr:NAD(P)H-binding protein [Pyrinomonadaceae bacterium]
MYVITGATGHTGGIVAKTLLGQGQKVRAIGRSADRLEALAAEGAEPFVCDITDAATLTKAFSGAKAVYAMVPPSMTSQNYRADQDRASNAIAEAVEKARVEYVVSLSSVGADKAQGTGPVVGLHYLEQKLNRIPSLNALHLRPGYFMENTLAQAGIIQTMGTTAGPVRADLALPMIATRDIGAAAAKALLELDFTDKQTRELLGQRDVSYDDAARIIGNAIGKPDLKYVRLPDEQVRGAFLQMGISENVADLILEMSAALNSGYMEPLEERTAENTTPTSFETFVTDEFLPLYRGKATTA